MCVGGLFVGWKLYVKGMGDDRILCSYCIFNDDVIWYGVYGELLLIYIVSGWFEFVLIMWEVWLCLGLVF